MECKWDSLLLAVVQLARILGKDIWIELIALGRTSFKFYENSQNTNLLESLGGLKDC